VEQKERNYDERIKKWIDDILNARIYQTKKTKSIKQLEDLLRIHSIILLRNKLFQ
jgi:hypothetical protein